MADTHHLIRRKGRWYYHRRVPIGLKGLLGSVIKQALGTADKKEAIRLREIRDVEWSARFDAAPDDQPQKNPSLSGGYPRRRSGGGSASPWPSS